MECASSVFGGNQGRCEIREIANSILCQGRTGCQWGDLPRYPPSESTVYDYFAAWRDDGTHAKIDDLLRWQVREKVGRSEGPSLVMIDKRSVEAAVNVPAVTTGRDVTKKVPGRKRGLGVDVLGLVIVVSVHAASALPSLKILRRCWSAEPEEGQWLLEGAEGYLAESGGDVGVAGGAGLADRRRAAHGCGEPWRRRARRHLSHGPRRRGRMSWLRGRDLRFLSSRACRCRPAPIRAASGGVAWWWPRR